ncbi:MAG: type II toxin-antitoxin system Phd/YefM family antitoxin [Solirubrobacterales bacterium]
MAEVSARDLRNHTRDVLDRVQRGESIEITVNRRPVAELRPARRKPHWIPWREMDEIIREHGADPGLLDDIAFMREQRVEFPDDK